MVNDSIPTISENKFTDGQRVKALIDRSLRLATVVRQVPDGVITPRPYFTQYVVQPDGSGEGVVVSSSLLQPYDPEADTVRQRLEKAVRHITRDLIPFDEIQISMDIGNPTTMDELAVRVCFARDYAINTAQLLEAWIARNCPGALDSHPAPLDLFPIGQVVEE